MRWHDQLETTHRAGQLPGLGDATVRTFDAPEAMEARFHEIHAKSALNRVPGASKLPFAWTVNPYRGCLHSCSYCFARPTHEYLDLDAGRDFEKQILVKVNAPEVLRVELARPSWRFEHVALGTNTDPYQWVEKRYGLTRAILEALRDARNPCSVLTKSPLLLRDVDVFLELCEVTDFSACLSIPTLDERAWRATEPATPHPRKRLEAVAALNAAGVPCGVLVAPLMPGINDAPEQVEAVVEACREAGATRVGGQALFLRGATKEVFMGYLRDRRPDLVPLYERLYGGRAWLQDADRKRVEAPLRRLARAYAPPPTGADQRFRGFGLADRWRSAPPPAADGPRAEGPAAVADDLVAPAGPAGPAGPDPGAPAGPAGPSGPQTPDPFTSGRRLASAAEVATGRFARAAPPPADGSRARPAAPPSADAAGGRAAGHRSATEVRVEEARLALGRQEVLF